MRNKLGDRQRLLHILDAITEIDSYLTNKNLEDFLSNSMMRFASIKQMEIIGEAANHVSSEIQVKFNETDWKKIIGLRHVLVHEYFGVDNQLIWQIIQKDIPKLKIKVEAIIGELE